MWGCWEQHHWGDGMEMGEELVEEGKRGRSFPCFLPQMNRGGRGSEGRYGDSANLYQVNPSLKTC